MLFSATECSRAFLGVTSGADSEMEHNKKVLKSARKPAVCYRFKEPELQRQL